MLRMVEDEDASLAAAGAEISSMREMLETGSDFR